MQTEPPFEKINPASPSDVSTAARRVASDSNGQDRIEIQKASEMVLSEEDTQKSTSYITGEVRKVDESGFKVVTDGRTWNVSFNHEEGWVGVSSQMYDSGGDSDYSTPDVVEDATPME